MKLIQELVQHKRWYTKLAIGSTVFGAAIEGFMILTGFYDKVTLMEAQRRAEFVANNGEQLTFQEFKKLMNDKFS